MIAKVEAEHEKRYKSFSRRWRKIKFLNVTRKLSGYAVSAGTFIRAKNRPKIARFASIPKLTLMKRQTK
jgi:hypothetical protein